MHQRTPTEPLSADEIAAIHRMLESTSCAKLAAEMKLSEYTLIRAVGGFQVHRLTAAAVRSFLSAKG